MNIYDFLSIIQQRHPEANQTSFSVRNYQELIFLTPPKRIDSVLVRFGFILLKILVVTLFFEPVIFLPYYSETLQMYKVHGKDQICNNCFCWIMTSSHMLCVQCHFFSPPKSALSFLSLFTIVIIILHFHSLPRCGIKNLYGKKRHIPVEG